MKKIFFAFAVALIMAIGTYSLVNTENVSVLITLENVEALARGENPDSKEYEMNVRVKVECCNAWIMTGVDANGVPLYTCTDKEMRDAIVCGKTYNESTCTPEMPC